MTQKNRTDLINSLNTDLPDNNTADISPADVRLNLIDGVDSNFNILTDDTDDVTEGVTNLFYTEARVSANTDVAQNTTDRHTHANKALLDTLTDAGAGTNYLADDGLYKAIGASSDELVKVSADDTTAGYLEDKVVGTAGKIVVSTLTPAGDEDLQINIGADVFDKVTDDSGDITEGTNLFYTETRVSNNASVSANTAKVSNATHTGDVTGATALTIANLAVTTAKINDLAVTTAKIDANAVTTSKLGNDSVTNTKLANMAQDTIKGRISTGSGDPEDLTATQVRTILNVADGATAGDADAIHDNVAGEINAVALKATPVSGDLLLIEDSADSNNKKRITIGSLPSSGGGLTTKAGEKLSGAFSGNPKVASVAFSTAFPDTNYAVILTSDVSSNSQAYTPQIANKTASGFDITLTTNSVSNLNKVTYIAIAYGES